LGECPAEFVLEIVDVPASDLHLSDACQDLKPVCSLAAYRLLAPETEGDIDISASPPSHHLLGQDLKKCSV